MLLVLMSRIHRFLDSFLVSCVNLGNAISGTLPVNIQSAQTAQFDIDQSWTNGYGIALQGDLITYSIYSGNSSGRENNTNGLVMSSRIWLQKNLSRIGPPKKPA